MDQRNILWYQVSLFGLREGFSIRASGVSLSFFLTTYSAHAQEGCMCWMSHQATGYTTHCCGRT